MSHDFLLLESILLDLKIIELNDMIKGNNNFKLFVRMFVNRYMSEKFDDIEWGNYDNQILLLMLSKYFFLL